MQLCLLPSLSGRCAGSDGSMDRAPGTRARRVAGLLSAGALLLAFWPCAARAAAFVQVAAATPQSAQTAVSVSFGKAQVAGDLNVVVVGWNDTTAAVQSVQDSSGNTYRLAVGPGVGTGLEQSLYYAPNILGGNNTVTVHFTKAAAYPDIRILEYSGYAVLDVTAGSAGNSASPASGAATTTQANELVVGAATVATAVTQPGSGFTARIITSPDRDVAEDKTVAAVGSNNAKATLNGPGPWVMQMATFSAAAASTSPSLAGLSCSSSSETGSATDLCSVSLTAAASTGGMEVSLASSNSAVTVPSSVTVAAGSISASFTATAAAVTSAQTATLTATAGNISKSFALQLKAYVATLQLGSSSIAFGDVSLNTPVTQSVTLTSAGTAPVTISNGTVTGSGYSLSGISFPLTLQAGQAAVLEVSFDPTTTGATTGTVAVASNCSMGTMAIALTGTGTSSSYSVDLSWDAPAASADPVAGYHVYRAAGASPWQLLNATVNVPASYTDTSVEAGTTYSYEVTSVDAQGNESTPSNVYTTTIP